MEQTKFDKQTAQGQPIVEIWKGKDSVGESHLFVIVKRTKDYSWGSYYHLDKGYWEHGHYDYPDLATARYSMLERYKDYKLDLVIKNS